MRGMVAPTGKSEEWNPQKEAGRAFALNDHVRAVIFFSDAPVAALRRPDQGPSRRQHKNLSQEIFDLLHNGKSDEARDKIANVRWRGPQTIFWTNSVAELLEVIERNDEIIFKHKIPAGVADSEVSRGDGDIVVFSVFWDRGP
jgi:hypothetical protein